MKRNPSKSGFSEGAAAANLSLETTIENPMGTRPVFPLLMRMAIPPMISMLIQSMYNIVDSIFVAQISQDALTAVSLAFPLQNLALAVAVGFGVGLNACIARNLGAGNQKAVDSAAAHGFYFSLLHSILFVIIGWLGSGPFLSLFSQDPEILKMGYEYSSIVLCLSFGNMFHLYTEKMFQAMGSMLFPMAMQAFGAGLNIVLDPLFIFGAFGLPGMGVKGAAVATILGQIAAASLSFFCFVRHSGEIHLSLRNFKLNGKILRDVYSVTIPSAIMMSLPSILVGILNGILAGLSQVGVAILGLYFKLQTFVYMPGSGLIQGMRPIVSYNYGAGKWDRMKQTVKCSSLVTVLLMAAGTLVFLLAPQQIMGLFQAQGELLESGVQALGIISLGFVVSSVGVVFSGVFEALGKGGRSLAISLIRQLLVIPPLALLLAGPLGMGATGVWVSFPAAELLAAVVALFLYKDWERREGPGRLSPEAKTAGTV